MRKCENTKIAKRVEGTFSNDHESYSGNSIQDFQIEKDDQLNVPMFEEYSNQRLP